MSFRRDWTVTRHRFVDDEATRARLAFEAAWHGPVGARTSTYWGGRIGPADYVRSYWMRRSRPARAGVRERVGARGAHPASLRQQLFSRAGVELFGILQGMC